MPFGNDDDDYRVPGVERSNSVGDFFFHEQAKFRGLAIMAWILFCLVLFAGGLIFPLVEVVILPGTPDAETRLVKSVMNMISLAFENGQIVIGLVLLVCTVVIPIVLFIGMLFVMYENFFASVLGWSHCLKHANRALLVSLMHISTSYQVVMIFLIMLFSVFFTGFGSETNLRAGFYFLALYCLASILLVQGMEFFRIEVSAERDEEQDTEAESEMGNSLRRNFSSFIPSLPGLKDTPHVDTFQVCFFQLLFLVLLISGFDQPLLDIRVSYKGLVLQSKVLSLRDMTTSLLSRNFFVMLLFLLLVVAIPVLYGCVLVLAGIVDTCIRCCGQETQKTGRELLDWILWVAKILRPWVMTDVFSMTLVIVLYVVQNEYVSATIPDGILDFGPNGLPLLTFDSASREDHWVPFGGMYSIVGAGIATLFLRWFWSTSANGEGIRGYIRVRGEKKSEAPPEGENPVFVYVASKGCRCLVVWTGVCALLHLLPPPPQFELASMNEALQRSVPALNKLTLQHAPQTVGNCQYPLQGTPQPCFEYGILDKQVQDKYRITAEWMSGMKTMRLTNISASSNKRLALPNASSLPEGVVASAPNSMNDFVLDISGVIGEPKLFLRIEECPWDHTTEKAILGKGLCKPFLDTSESCCESNRRFTLRLAADCRVGDTALSNMRVQDMTLDTMIVRPEMFKEHVKLVIANKNITKMVLDNVEGNIMYYLTEEPVMRIGGQELTVVDFVNRLLRFNAPHQDFRCR